MNSNLFIVCFIFVISPFLKAYENNYFKQKNPDGWIEQPVSSGGWNYMFISGIVLGQDAPTLVSMTLDLPTDFKDAQSFLKKSLKDSFSKQKGFDFYAENNLKIKLPDSSALVEYKYFSNQGTPHRGFAAVIVQKNLRKYHYFQFSTSKEKFNSFGREIADSMNTLQLK